MKGWNAAQESIGVDGRGDPMSKVGPVPGPSDTVATVSARITFVENLRLAMIAMPEEVGAVVRIRPISKTEAMRLSRADEAQFATAPEYAMSFFEKELGIGELPRARLGPGSSFVVAEKISWRDIRWFLVEYLSDGDGVVDDGGS